MASRLPRSCRASFTIWYCSRSSCIMAWKKNRFNLRLSQSSWQTVDCTFWRYLTPPWMSLVDLDDVPDEKSSSSTMAVVNPRVWASRAHWKIKKNVGLQMKVWIIETLILTPDPVAPPPMTSTSNCWFFSRSICSLRLGKTPLTRLLMWVLAIRTCCWVRCKKWKKILVKRKYVPRKWYWLNIFNGHYWNP